MENKFKEGQLVHVRTDLYVKLVIKRYFNKIYYCNKLKYPSKDDLVYFERELVAADNNY